MSFHFIKVSAQGTLVRDPKLIPGKSGTSCITSSIVINRYYTDQNNNPQSSTTYFDWSYWCRDEDLRSNQFKKGERVEIEGDIFENVWEASPGEKRKKHYIKVRKIKHVRD